MKTTPRVNPSCFWLLILLALSVAVVATSMSPDAAEAKTRPENTQPLAGDPDTPEAPYSGGAKSARFTTELAFRPTSSAFDSRRIERSALDRYRVLAAYWWLRLRGF